ncbi:MAG: hypothetical protein ACKVQS_06520 [Fimbriimonadaceae bacterium]
MAAAMLAWEFFVPPELNDNTWIDFIRFITFGAQAASIVCLVQPMKEIRLINVASLSLAAMLGWMYKDTLAWIPDGINRIPIAFCAAVVSMMVHFFVVRAWVLE